jgi:hypothetical protein
MSEQSTKLISPELEQAFYDAVYACRDWMLDPVREPEVYVNPDRSTRHKISAICQFILAYENMPLPQMTFDELYKIQDVTRRNLKWSLDVNASYHAGARCLLELIEIKRRRG